MVIYLHNKNSIKLKFLVFMLFLIFIYGVGYICSFLRYDNRELIETKVLLTQNQLLKKELEDSKIAKNSYDCEIGKVIIRDMHNFYNEVVIDIESENVKIGSPVINEEGLIGIIYKKEKTLSYVKLLTSDYNVSVKIKDTYGNLNAGKITLVDKYADIKVGDLVYTSGLNEIPKDIYIGKIKKVNMDNENLGKEIEIELINNKYLNYVGVIST